MSDEQPVVFDDDNPEWTEEDFARAKPLSAFPELKAALERTNPAAGQVAVYLPRPVVEHYRAGGPGWQTRMIEVLERAAGLAR